MTTALIIGAGVAGPVTAMALQRGGIDAVVYEAHPRPADDIGAFLTLQTNGIDALRAIDAYDAVAEHGFPTPVMRFFSGSGKHLGTVPNGGTLDDGTASHTLKRADLYRSLGDEARRRGIHIEHGRRLVDARTDAGRVTAMFADGSTAQGDLLIGCDGIRSRVRELIDPKAPPARYVPMLNLGGYARGVETGAGRGEYHMIFGKRAFFGYVVAPDAQTWWFANPPSPADPGRDAMAAITTEQWRARLLDLYTVDRSPAVDLLRATEGPLRGWTTYDIPTIPTWHRERMIVIGDAAHATSPSSGQGASMAIEDAVILGKCVRDVSSLDEAFARYESLRRGRVERVVAIGARASNDKVAGPVGRVLRDLMMPLFLRRAAGRGRSSLTELYRHHIDWDTPVDGGVAAPARTGHQ